MTIGRLLPLLACAANCILTGASMTTAQAADIGRYQSEVIQGGATPQVLFLDTRDGHFWVWSQMIRGSDQQLRYQGRLRPGSSEGETIFESGIRHPRR
jgi:hypothetical protein